MKLIKEIISKRLELHNELELNHDYIKSLWNFYSAYNICLIISGHFDKEINKKNNLMKRLLFSSCKDFNFSVYNKLLSYVKKDMEIINRAMIIIGKREESEDIFGDYDIPNMIAVSIHD